MTHSRPRIALIGGSFDPVHHGHLIIARNVAERMGIGRVIFLPTASPPHKAARDLADPEHRTRMVQAAIEGEPGFELDETDLNRPGPTYTLDTIAHFREQVGPAAELIWVIGGDSLAELASWHRVAELVDACRIVTALRSGSETLDLTSLTARLSDEQVSRLKNDVLATPRIDISSTEIRRRVAAGRSIRYLVPETVVRERCLIAVGWILEASGHNEFETDVESAITLGAVTNDGLTVQRSLRLMQRDRQ